MGLPAIALNSGEVELPGGHKVKIRGLSRAEVLRMAGHGDDTAALEVEVIATATGESEDAVREWFAASPSYAVQAVVDGVLELSGLSGDLGKGSSGD